MDSNGRGLRLMNAMKLLSKSKPDIFENQVFKKVKITSICDGVVNGQFTVEPSMCNIGGLIHGGYMASVFDVMSYYAQLSQTGGKLALTTTISINYIAVALQGETLTVQTKVLESGQTPVIETCICNAQGNTIAKATTCFSTAPERYQTLMKDIFDINNDD